MQTAKEKLLSGKYNLFIIIFITFICYGNTLFNGFVYDDKFVVEGSSFIKSFSNVKLLFSKEYFENTVELSYRPVVTFSYFIDYFFWKLNPIGFHLTNVLLHLSCVILLYFLFRRFFTQTISLIGALLFAVHPINTEAVNAISYREDLLATLFFIVCFLLYIQIEKYDWKKTIVYTLLFCISFFLGLFSKETVLTLPLIIAIYHLTIRRTLSGKQIPNIPFYIPLWIISGVIILFYIAIRFVYFLPTKQLLLPHLGGSVIASILNFPYIFNYYLSLMIFPIHLRADYSFKGLESLVSTQAIFSYIMFTLYLLTIILCFRKYKDISFSLLWILITLLPVSNILPLSNPIAERYLYLSAIGFVFLLAAFMRYCVKEKLFDIEIGETKQKINGCILLLSIVVVAYYGLTMWRNIEWGDERLLWSSNYKLDQNSLRAINGLGLVYFSEGVKENNAAKIEEAKKLFERGATLNPYDYKLRNNLGVLYAREKNYDKAIGEFEKAAELLPGNKNAEYNITKCYLLKKDYSSAYMHMQFAKSLGAQIPKEMEDEINTHINANSNEKNRIKK